MNCLHCSQTIQVLGNDPAHPGLDNTALCRLREDNLAKRISIGIAYANLTNTHPMTNTNCPYKFQERFNECPDYKAINAGFDSSLNIPTLNISDE